MPVRCKLVQKDHSFSVPFSRHTPIASGLFSLPSILTPKLISTNLKPLNKWYINIYELKTYIFKLSITDLSPEPQIAYFHVQWPSLDISTWSHAEHTQTKLLSPAKLLCPAIFFILKTAQAKKPGHHHWLFSSSHAPPPVLTAIKSWQLFLQKWSRTSSLLITSTDIILAHAQIICHLDDCRSSLTGDLDSGFGHL